MAKKAKGQELQALRQAIMSKLAQIASASEGISAVMDSQPHPEKFGTGSAYLVVKPYAGIAITHNTDGSFVAHYHDDKGQYTIHIHKTEKTARIRDQGDDE